MRMRHVLLIVRDCNRVEENDFLEIQFEIQSFELFFIAAAESTARRRTSSLSNFYNHN